MYKMYIGMNSQLESTFQKYWNTVHTYIVAIIRQNRREDKCGKHKEDGAQAFMMKNDT